MFGNFSLKTPFLGWVSIPNTFVLLFIFYILSYLLSKIIGCLSGCLMFSASVQKLFCGICSAFKYAYSEFLGEKVASPSYSWDCPHPRLLFKPSLYIWKFYIQTLLKSTLKDFEHDFASM